MDVDIQQFEFGKNLSYINFDNNNKIVLLYKKTHYDLLYNDNYYNSYKNIFKLTLFNYINNFNENICRICSKNEKNTILIKLESDIDYKNEYNENIKRVIIICYKCLFKEIKQNLTLLYIFFIKKTKKFFLDNFSEQFNDFLQKRFTLFNNLMDITFSHSINTLLIYKPKYNFEYIINQIKNDICICCNANINDKNSYNNMVLKPKIILPCNCMLCSDNCVKEFYYILLSGAYIKQEFICFCNKKYNFENCLLMIEKYNEKKFDCKEMIEFLFDKINKKKCFLCLNENNTNLICLVIEPKFVLNHIIRHYICDECFKQEDNYLGQNVECAICKRNHIIDKLYNQLKSDYIQGYNLDNNSIKNINNNNDKQKKIAKDENEKNEVKKNINNKNSIIKKDNYNKGNINEDNKNKNKNNCINYNNNNYKNINYKEKKIENISNDSDDNEEERVTIIKINRRKKI